MEVTIRLDEPNFKIIPHDNPNPQYTHLEIESYVSDSKNGILNKQYIHGTPEQFLAFADAIYKTWGKKEVDLPQSSYDDEAMDEVARNIENRKSKPELEVKNERIAS